MGKKLILSVLSGLLTAGAWAAPTSHPAQKSGKPEAVRPLFGDVFREASGLAASFDGIRVAGCPTGESPICTRWETTYEPYCEQWETRDGGAICRKWLYRSIETCKNWACGADH